MTLKGGNALFMNIDKEDTAFNTSSEEVMISPGYYQIIGMLNTITNTTFSISTIATSVGCIISYR